MWMSFAVGAHPLVTSYITSIQNEDFFVLKKKGYRYDDTWDTEPFYAEIRSRELHKQAKPINVRQAHMEETIAKIRDGALGVGRLALACRSADLTCIFRGIRSEHDTLRFYFQSTAVHLYATTGAVLVLLCICISRKYGYSNHLF